MAIQKSTLWQTAQKLLILWIILGFAFFIAGICCLSIYFKEMPTDLPDPACKNASQFKYINIALNNYTNCTNEDGVICHEYIARTNESCSCIEYFDVTKDWEGDIVVSYELSDFNKSTIVKQPNYFSSRDDLQLNGTLSPNISETCSPYALGNDGKPIAPCGAIADAMFTDDYTVVCDNVTLPKLYTGLLLDSEKEGFRNPPPKDDLQTAFQNFSKPKNWPKNIWELSSDPQNNGFENEGLIAWMRTDLARKPRWRLDRSKNPFTKGLTGIKGECTIYISYNYPYSRYNGERKVIIAQRVPVYKAQCNDVTITGQHSTIFGFGVAGVVLGFILLVSSAILFITATNKQVTGTDAVIVNGTKFNPSEPFADATLRIESDTKEKKYNNSPVLKDVKAEEKLIVKPQSKHEDKELDEEPLKPKAEEDEDYL